ncbi:MAG: AAA domain-containing protein [Flavobacterium sp. JAD_PAG50586_2]|nr:MAG: AAA domain-containing protein [Flavobacterium sp. JAD_PAG50586_2]
MQGPPGTGKTTVIAEIIQQLTSKGKKILVAGQNHVAVDNVLEKISKLHHLNLLRVGNPDRVDRELVRYSIDNLIDDYKSDFYTFQNNQVLLSKEYLSFRLAKLSREHIYKKYTDLVNDISRSYVKLENVYREKHFVLREGLESMTDSEIEDTIQTLQQWIISIKDEYEILLKPVIYNSVDVVFATCIGIRTDKVFEDASFNFDTVIIDEAGKANIAETLAAIELGEKIILVGDQKQLPPYVDSSQIDNRNPSSFNRTSVGSNYLESEINHALKTSFFEFIIDRINAGSFPKENLVMLNYQHRMHPNIGKFVSKSFYNNEVLMGERTYLNKLNLPAPLDQEVIFFDTSNSDKPYEQKDNISYRNDTEAETISEIILPRIFENNIASSDIAIITPYKSQVNNIQKYINRSSLTTRKNIDIASLDSFQGKEYDIIIFSFTRSSLNQKVGFLDNAQRLNVAFSRAKKN